MCVSEGKGDLIHYFGFFPLKGLLLRYFRLCYRLIMFLSMLILHFILLACFGFKTSFIHLDRRGFFDICEFFLRIAKRDSIIEVSLILEMFHINVFLKDPIY